MALAATFFQMKDSGTSPSGPVKCVVAIGGSAGALEAFENFVRGLPEDSSAAYVFLQHMDPAQKSHLPELLQHVSRLPVHAANDGVELKANQIYVLQPGTSLTLNGPRFVSKTLEHTEERRHPIDIFFGSLAREFKTHAVGIVVSGTGMDGANGLRMIRELGGRTIVQIPVEAKFDGMPQSAIAAGVADRIVPAKDMGKLLSAFVECSPVSETPQINEDELNRVCEALLRITGHDFSAYKKSTVARRVERRVQAHALSEISEYLEVLENDPTEAQALLKDLLISVTQFFRDPEAFSALAKLVIPKLFTASRKGEAVRVWVPACATGEEAYTVAILLKEYQRLNGPASPVQIFATDIDRAALELARAGLYPSTIEENISPEYLNRYFNKEESGYRAKQELRETCIFSEHSLLKNPPFSRLDLISCRNLFIYWEAELQNKILPVFHYALNSDGFLFLGPAESVSGTAELFKTVEKRFRIYQRAEVSSRAHLYAPIVHSGSRAKSRQAPLNAAQAFSDRDVSKTIVSNLLEDFAPPAFVITSDGEIVFFSGKTGKFLEPPTGAPSTLIFEVIRRFLRAELHALVHKSIKTKSEVSHAGLTFENEGSVQKIKLIVKPLAESADGKALYLVVFQELMPPKSREEAAREGIMLSSTDSIVQQLEGELRETRDHLQSTIEEVKSSNEELLSMNEELQSANEELQTSKEELQSTNEELETVNTELSKKVDELDASNGDLHNFFSSAQVPILFLDRKFQIQRFTPAATQIFRLIPTDIGRGISDITSDLENIEFSRDFTKVLETLQSVEREVSTRDGKFRYIMRVSPYRTLGNVIDGVIATFADISDLKVAQEVAEHAHEQVVDVLESMSDAFFSVDKDWKINQINAHHEKLTQKTRKEQIGRSLIDLFFSAPEYQNSIYLKSYRKAMTERIPVYFEDYYAPIDLWTGVSVYPKSDGGLAVFFKDIADEKKSALRIAEEKLKLETVFAKSPVGMALLRGPNLIFEKVNDQWVDLIGEKREYLGRSYVEVHPELKDSDIPKILKKVFDTGIPYSNKETPARIEVRKGVFEDRYYDANFVQVLDAEGKPYGVYCHTMNVTETIGARKKLEESERRFQQLADSLPQIVWTADANGVVDYFNERWYEYTGTSREAVTEGIWASILHPDDVKLRNDNFAHSVATGLPYRVEYRFLDIKTGEYRWFLGRAAPIRNENGKITKWFGSSTDIDETKRAEENLREARQELHDFLMQAPIGIALLSGPNHIYNFMNPSFTMLCFGGRPDTEFLGKSVRVAVPELAGQGFYEILDEVYRTGKSFVGAKLRATMKQASGLEKELYLNFTYQAKRDKNGKVDGILAVIYEVTDQVNEQKEFEVLADNLRAAILSRDNFLAIASHELNTPLTSLKLQTQMNKRILERKGPEAFTPELLNKLLDNTLFQTERLGRLVNDMLDVSRVSSGKLTIEVADTDLSALVTETLERFTPQMDAAGCALRKEIPPQITVSLDASRIEQVIVNFVTNAMKYAPGKPVHAKVERVNDFVKVSVRDEGPGIAPENQDRIFGRFERATLTNDVSGLGLGLYICKQIIEEHHGKIYVQSKLGEGSTFVFELPAR